MNYIALRANDDAMHADSDEYNACSMLRCVYEVHAIHSRHVIRAKVTLIHLLWMSVTCMHYSAYYNDQHYPFSGLASQLRVG